MRRIVGLLAVLALGFSAGCSRQCFMTETDFYHAHGLPAQLENDPHDAVQPFTAPIPAPPNLDHPERPPRFLTLPEAIAIALENGSPSSRAGFGTGAVDDALATFPNAFGQGLSNQTDRVRVLALNPAIAQASMESSLARFDAQWVTAMNWSN